MLEESLFNTFKDIGEDMSVSGLFCSPAGHMSVLVGDRIYITRRAAILMHLKPTDIIEGSLKEKNDSFLPAPPEVSLHKAIYLRAGGLAIIEAQPPHATLLSMVEDELVPLDWEGSHILERVPIVALGGPVDSEKGARAVCEHLKDHKIILVRGHGSFARGNGLEEAFMLTSSLELSAFFLSHLRERAGLP